MSLVEHSSQIQSGLRLDRTHKVPVKSAESSTVSKRSSTISGRARPVGKTLLVSDLSVFLFLLYFITKPIYLFPSGGPQISDAFAFLALLLVAVEGKFELLPDFRKPVSALTVFVVYTITVNVFWAVFVFDAKLLTKCLFYLYNLAIFVMFLHFAGKYQDRFLKLVALSLLISVLGMVILSLAMPSLGGQRRVITFNNPNQLAYWTLLSACIFAACAHRVKIHFLLSVAFYLGILYVSFLSLSKAAMAATVALLVMVFWRKPQILLVAVACSVIVLVTVHDGAILDNLYQRVSHTQEDDNLIKRGYDLLWTYPEYLIFGSGEGAFERFSAVRSREFHSTLGTILFSYGIVGLAAFLLFVFRTWRAVGLFHFCLFIPPMLYGVAHQGLRFSLLWILFAAILIGRVEGSNTEARIGSATT